MAIVLVAHQSCDLIFKIDRWLNFC